MSSAETHTTAEVDRRGSAAAAPFTYLFEVKSLQRYIFETGRLYDMVAASALIDALCRAPDSLLDRVAESLPRDQQPRFSRRVGGALAAHFPNCEALVTFRTRWTLALQVMVPGLEFVQASAAGKTVADSAAGARDALGASHNAALALLPAAGPLSERAPRTGRAAVARSLKDGELIDAATAGKQRAARRLYEPECEGSKVLVDPVAARLDVKLGDGSPARWPLNLNDAEVEDATDGSTRVVFPYQGGVRSLGIIHADGNGLGQLVMALGSANEWLGDAQYIALMSEFSERLDNATHDAVRAAAQCALVERAGDDGVLPARPFILGGDDLGIIVRADCAVEFTRAFLEAFEETTAGMIERLQLDFKGALAGVALPERLTAAAGIAFVKPHQPFYRAYALAESLCTHAKRVTKKRLAEKGLVPSALAFHRVTTSMIDEYRLVRERELVYRRNEKEHDELSMQPWFVGQGRSGGPQLEHLLALRDCQTLPLLSMSRLREVLEAAATDPDRALVLYRRWRDVVGARGGGALAAFDAAFCPVLGGSDVRETFWQATRQEETRSVRRTPLADVLALVALSAPREELP